MQAKWEEENSGDEGDEYQPTDRCVIQYLIGFYRDLVYVQYQPTDRCVI